jgi:Flp pilus assembly protein TadB
MNDDKPIEQAKATWQAQRVELPPLYELKVRALDHAKQGRERSLLEYVGASVGVIVCVWLAVATGDMLLRTGLVILSVSGLYWLAEWRRRTARCRYRLPDRDCP